MRGGILRGEPGYLEVSFAHLTSMKSWDFHESLSLYFKSQGFAEPEELPYRRIEIGLVVTRSLPEWGYEPSVYIDGIPF